jgi:hypothetical protein
MLGLENDFEFVLDSAYVIPEHNAGRVDKIAQELFDNPTYYIAICSFNNIRVPYITRDSIRPIEGSNNEWVDYNNIYEGFIGDAYTGRTLMIPTYETVIKYMSLFGVGK